MESNNKYSMIISTCPDKECAKATARTLVEKRLAACVQMLPIESVYTWKDDVCEEPEVILLIKSKAALFEKIVTAIRDIHPYEVPEVIQIPITGGFLEYLNWVDDSTVL